MMTCEVFLGDNLSHIRSIAMLDSGRGRVDGLGDSL